MLIRWLCCCGMGAARLLELAYSRRNLRRMGVASEGVANRVSYPLVVLLHTVVILGTVFWGKQPRPRWLLLLLTAQPVRLWVLTTLRERWNTRGAVARTTEVATNGPYAYMRHPNYAVVAVELFCLPVAFGLPRFAICASIANGLLLAVRIRDEERLLAELPGYPEHFDDKPRFVPSIRLRRRIAGRQHREASGF
ncbi:MAG TPA: isoprenylcysteine carboxylmethyltransferase family protein [Dehalococcoidia bacterium]|nr:isoprenylcysteine carboxylmethyltransferase family protein [Dehalococcoidia bacterium]